MTVEWSPLAVADVKAIHAYIAKDSLVAAERMVVRIKEAVERLADFPPMGRAGRVAGTREFVIPGSSYICAYLIQSDCVHVAAVLHGKQSWPKGFR